MLKILDKNNTKDWSEGKCAVVFVFSVMCLFAIATIIVFGLMCLYRLSECIPPVDPINYEMCGIKK